MRLCLCMCACLCLCVSISLQTVVMSLKTTTTWHPLPVSRSTAVSTFSCSMAPCPAACSACRWTIDLRCSAFRVLTWTCQHRQPSMRWRCCRQDSYWLLTEDGLDSLSWTLALKMRQIGLQLDASNGTDEQATCSPLPHVGPCKLEMSHFCFPTGWPKSPQDLVSLCTVKPLMLTCPLFREFHEPNKTAKLKGANINCRPK